MKRGEEEAAPCGAAPVVGTFPYSSGAGRCIILDHGGGRLYGVYFVDGEEPPRFMGTHQTLRNAESVARWMAMGL